MAQTTITRLSHTQTNTHHLLFGLLSLMSLMRTSSAREFIVGGSTWTPQGNNSALNYNQWAEHNRFQIGDSIVFSYPPGQDSLLQVTREDYSSCTTTSPLHKYSDGHTVFTFYQSGPYYFISGNKGNCQKNQKLIVIVLADRGNTSSSTNQTISTALSPPPISTNDTTTASPPPISTNDTTSPPPPTTTDMDPVPAPTDNYSPPPPGTEEINPTPAPVGTLPKNTASSVHFGSIGCFGAVVSSSIIFSIPI